jgi:ferric-dicitrate binding protein FerR (iron transport regulator)
MEQNAPWHLFFKCFQNQASFEEIDEVNDWLQEDPGNLKMLEELYYSYSVSTRIPKPLSPDIQVAWEKVSQKISSKPNRVKSLFNRFKYAVAIAAVIVISLTIYGITDFLRNHQLNNQYTEITTLPGQKTSVMLPDSSVVWLNSASSLRYNRNFNSKERKVSLNGEAFFEVRKDKSRKFRVETGSLNIDVHGTSFNIRNYLNDPVQEVTVTEGVVGISCRAREIRRLTKGEQALLNRESGKITFTRENPDMITAWKNNELIFRNTPVEEVIKYLERWYGVNITIDGVIKDKYNYTFKVKTESFREMLEMMRIMTPLDYKISGKDVTIRYNN